MRLAVLADVHANLEALTAVLGAIDRERVDAIVALGDHVGYHADPDRCVELLRERGVRAIAGNHDRAALGELALDVPRARRAAEWTRAQLRDDTRAYLAALPLTCTVEGMLLFHAALHPTPASVLHLSSPARVARTFDALIGGYPGVRIALFGHTHVPVVHVRGGASRRAADGLELALDPGATYLMNPGSVGQPRDGDPRAAFAVLDTTLHLIRFHRVRYDARVCHAKAARAGLVKRRLISATTGALRSWLLPWRTP